MFIVFFCFLDRPLGHFERKWKMIKNMEDLERLLRKGREESPIYTKCVNGWTHWWVDNIVHAYGQGPGWFDQDDVVRDACDIKKYVARLWLRRKEINEHLQAR